MSGTPPPQWPPQVNYVSACVFDPRVPKAALSGIWGTKTVSGGARGKTPVVGWARIVPITDPKHPAWGQRGLVAARPIPKQTHILDYAGVVTTDAFCSQKSEYTLRLRDDISGACVGQADPLRTRSQAPDLQLFWLSS
jgi:hypothetical protein